MSICQLQFLMCRQYWRQTALDDPHVETLLLAEFVVGYAGAEVQVRYHHIAAGQMIPQAVEDVALRFHRAARKGDFAGVGVDELGK